MKNIKPKFQRKPTEEEEKVISNLKTKIGNIDKEMENLKGEVDVGEKGNLEHIRCLHEYNEIKDVTQDLLGKLANIKGTTTKKLYPDFGLEEND